MEIELRSRDETVNIPDFIEIISEVTGNKKYSNAAMSENFPEEILNA
jgi:CYTH domain-containing protein